MKSLLQPLLLCLVFTLCTTSSDLFGQRPGGTVDQNNIADTGDCTANGTVIINEVGNVSEDKYGNNASEFIELIVVSDNPTIPVNLSGLVIDDNHSTTAGNNATPGHVRLGDCFNNIMPGTIILIYDDMRSFPGIDPSKDGAPNLDGVYQIPFNSDCLVKYDSCPSIRSAAYNCAPLMRAAPLLSQTPEASGQLDWRDFLHMDDAEDVLQIRDDKGVLHALMWHQQSTVVIDDPKGGGKSDGLFYPDQLAAEAVFVTSGGVGDQSIYFSGQDPFISSDYSLAFAGYTPGAANDSTNAAYITSLQAIVCVNTGIEIGCPGNSDYCYVWENDPTIVPLQGGQAMVYPEKNTTYIRTTLDGDGNLLGTQSYFIMTHPTYEVAIDEEQLTPGDCVAEANFRFTATVDSGNYDFAWSNGATTAAIEVPGDQPYSLTVTGPNGCEVIKEITAQGNQDMLASAKITASSSYFCSDAPVQLSVALNNYSGNGNRTYSWSNGSTAAVSQISLPGEYRVTVTTSTGCSFQDTITISPPVELTINADGEQACSNNPVRLVAEILGDPGQGIFYEWSTGATTSEIFVTEAGTYSLTTYTAEGCNLTANYSISGGVSLDLTASAERLVPGDFIQLHPNANGGIPPYAYQWSTGSTAENLAVNVAGTYTVTVTDKYGCTDSQSIEISPHDPDLCEGLSASIIFHTPDCAYDGGALLESVIASAYEVSAYDWSTGAVTSDAIIQEGGLTYTLTVTTTNGCQTSTSIVSPVFESLASSTGSSQFCGLLENTTLLSLGEQQAAIAFLDFDQTQLDQLLVGHEGVSITLTVSYMGENGLINKTLPFVSAGNIPDPTSYVGDLVDLTDGTTVEIGMEVNYPNTCPVTCENSKTFTYEVTEDEEEVILEENPEIVLTDYDCGDEFFPDSTQTNTEPLLTLDVGEIILVNGFPILIQEIQQNTSSNGSYTGTGVVPTPWNNKTLKVEFSGKVNKYRVIYEGTVDGISDNLNNHNFVMDTLTIGQEICQPQENDDEYDGEGIDPESGIDQWGFVDSTGIHSQTGQAWDQYGFDRNGNHIDTNSTYGPNGCSRESRDANGNDCQPIPYVDPAAQAFIDSITNNLQAEAEAVLTTLITAANDSLTLKKQACNNIRTVMDGLISEDILNFDRKAIFGDSSQYYSPGMSRRFVKKPEAFVPNIERDPEVIMLETHHIKLYGCDEAELVLIQEHADLVAVEISGLLAFLLQELSYLTEAEINTLNTDNEFNEWIATKIVAFVAESAEDANVYTTPGSFPTPYPSETGAFNIPEHKFNQLATVAAQGFGNMGFSSLEEQVLYELNSQFKQGFQSINGVHRAHILDKLHQYQMEEDSSASSNLLPLGITKYIGGMKYTILLDGIKFMSDNGPMLNAYMILEDPESGQKLVFEALNTPFGVGGANNTRLQLASTVAIRINNAAELILEPERNFVDWDCSGFAGMAVGGKVELCRNFITPLNEQTLEPLADSIRFALDFEVYIPEWLDAVIAVDAGAFALTNHDNIKWQLDSVIIDLSDRETPQFVPTEGYTSPHYENNHFSPLWRGFYMSNLSATLPSGLGTPDTLTGNPVTVGVQDVLIDGKGFTGEAYVEGVDILGLQEGSAGGWPFSINRFNVKVIHNGFVGGGFGGDLIVPIFPDDTLNYNATIYSNNRFKFSVSADTTVTMNMLLAKVTLLPATKIELGYDYSGFHAVADLTGNMKFNIPEDAPVDLKMPELYFKEFRVSNRDPYFDAGTWEIRNQAINISFGGFGMDLSRIKPYRGASGTTEFGVGFDLAINVGPDLSAGGRFGILGELEEVNNRQRWNFKEIDLQGLFIDAKISESVHVMGALEWFKDPTYGKGFQGLLDANFNLGVTSFEVQAGAMFGNINDTKYFYVDAMANLGATPQPSPLQITGFGGGVSYHMKNDFSTSTMDLNTPDTTSLLPPLGQTISGITYTVDPSIGLALKASISLAAAKKELFNGWAGLEFVFNAPAAGGGLREIAIKGQGQFMADVLPEPPAFVDSLTNVANAVLPLDSIPAVGGSTPVPVTAWIDLSYNFNDKVFDGKLETFMNLQGFITGAGHNNALVQAALYVDREKWYLNIGTPTHPAGILVQAPGFTAGATAYFNMGTDIPDFPGLPTNVASMAGLINTNEGLRKSGGGVMFGANFFVDAEIKAGPIYGFLEADLGFDLMLRDYGNSICAGSNERIGINGWYAAGQAWVYLNGGVRLFGVPIFEAGVAGVMQARLPNPLWAKATMAARVKLLFVEKKVKFDIEIGERCSLVDANGDELPADPIINYLDPLNQAQEVATDAIPSVYFNYPIGESFVGATGESYRAEVTTLKLSSLSGGYQLGYEEDWGDGNSFVRLKPYSLLPGEDSIRLEVTVAIMRGNTTERTESQTIVFQTAKAYDYIPLTNVKYSYPVNGMYDFYPQEYSRQEGFIQLNSGQAALLTNLEPGTSHFIVLEDVHGEEQTIPFSYNVVERLLAFDLPAATFTQGAYYRLSVIAENEAKERRELLAPIQFRVSQYNKFNDKLAAAGNAPDAIGPSIAGIGYVAKRLQNGLFFDDVERLGSGLDNPLIRFRAGLLNPYVQQLDNLVNDAFPMSSNTGCGTFTYAAANRYPTLYDAAGVSSHEQIFVNDETFTNGSLNLPENFTQYLQYDIPGEVYRRFQAVEDQISGCIDVITQEFTGEPGQGNATLDATIRNQLGDAAYLFYRDATFPSTPAGVYEVRVNYTLPNGQITTPGRIYINYTPASGNGPGF